MNKVLKFLLITALVAGAAMGCTNDNPAPGDVADEVKPVQIPARIAEGTNVLSFNFLHKFQETQPAGENLFVSPLSLHMAMGMLLNGAEDETAAEILKALQMEGVSVAELNEAYKTLITDLPVADAKVNLGLANSLWYKAGFEIQPDFKSVLKSSFIADATGLPFDAAAKDKINQWASEKTNGKIRKVIDEIKPEQVMFLLNALYFKGDWKTKFDTKNTVDQPFKLENGSSRQVKMMFAKSDFKTSRTSGYSAIQLPYSNGQFTMTLLIPSGENTIDKLLADFDASDWEQLQNGGLRTGAAEVGLPRFTLDYSARLNETLQEMGVKRAFTEAAQLGKISQAERLYVDFVKQDAYLGIDEKGTEAAAVTAIGIGVTSAGPEPQKYICDRPFALIISENTSNTILFMGRIKNPESK